MANKYTYTLSHDWVDDVSLYHFTSNCDGLEGCWFGDDLGADEIDIPSDIEKVIKVLDINFEPDKGESIRIESANETPIHITI